MAVDQVQWRGVVSAMLIHLFITSNSDIVTINKGLPYSNNLQIKYYGLMGYDTM
jgi:hypothetical protein